MIDNRCDKKEITSINDSIKTAMAIMIIVKLGMRRLLNWREDMRLCDSGTIHLQHSRAISFSLQFTFDYKDLFQQEPGMQTGGGKNM